MTRSLAGRSCRLLIWLLVLLGCALWLPERSRASEQPGTQAPAALPYQVYLPYMTHNYPWQSPLGVQSEARLTGGVLLSRTSDLKIGWARVAAVRWRRAQPVEGGPIDWSQLAQFEQELRALKQAGIAPEVTILDSPRWATVNVPYPTACGAIRTDKFGAFAAFVRALVQRYSVPEFDVHNWELGNEVDVDPRLVGPDSGFGCWGDINDRYYGGRHYGEMLKVVAPAVRAADRRARIWVGGLLLDLPHTTDPAKGRPELFLQGILEAGAAPYFDVVPYHAYPAYPNKLIDPDRVSGQWNALGGLVVGKARFLRGIMQSYGADKPLFLNEVALMCPEPPYTDWCSPPASDFYEMQAVFLVRAFTRALAEHVEGAIWFSINGPGWRYTGLTDQYYNPTPAYKAYQQFSAQIADASFARPVDYGLGVESYEFIKIGQRMQVVWANQNQTLAILIPRSQFLGAADRNGNPVQPIVYNSQTYLLLARFDPMYLTLTP